MSECVVLLIDSVFNDGIHNIVLIFTYVAPESSPIYSPENDDEIVILKEKYSPLDLSIQKQKYFLQEILMQEQNNFWTLYHPYQLKHEISHDVQGLHLFRWYKIVIPCLSTCRKLVDYLHIHADSPWYNYYIYQMMTLA